MVLIIVGWMSMLFNGLRVYVDFISLCLENTQQGVV